MTEPWSYMTICQKQKFQTSELTYKYTIHTYLKFVQYNLLLQKNITMPEVAFFLVLLPYVISVSYANM
jgi:hypothetical protein